MAVPPPTAIPRETGETNQSPQSTTLDYAHIPRQSKERGRIVRRLPLIFGVANLVICAPLLVFDVIGYARFGGWDQVDLIIMLIALIDFPVSIPLIALGVAMDADVRGAGPGPIAFIALLFLIAGFFWYYLLGMALRRLLRSVKEWST